jgi:phosphate starvation-inducible PhoH-like protein
LVDAIKNDMVFAVVLQEQERPILAMAIKALKEKTGKTYLLTRPAVEAGENLGFLPGDMKEKLIPICSRYMMLCKDMLPNEKK